MRTILTSIVGSIATITISKVFLIWWGSQLGVTPEYWVAKFIGVAERGVTAYPVISIIIHGGACLIVLLFGLFFYKLSIIIFGREDNVVQKKSTNGPVIRSLKKRILKIIFQKLLLLIMLFPKLLSLIVLYILNILFPDLQFPKRLLLKILLPKKRIRNNLPPIDLPRNEPIPEKQFLPTDFPKNQLNDWRANLNTIKTLRTSANGKSSVTIHYTDIRNYLFAERLALAFRESGWKVYFKKNAHEKCYLDYYGRVEISGDDRILVESIAASLESSGCVSIKKTVLGKKLDYFQSITLTYYQSDKKNLRKEIVITIGYQELDLTTVA